MRQMIWLCPVFLQHAAIGAVTSLIVAEQWGGVLIAAFVLQWFWWINMGQRIERHGQHGAMLAYCLTGALGITCGAMVWR